MVEHPDVLSFTVKQASNDRVNPSLTAKLACVAFNVGDHH